jgi:DNA-binding NtrC family response regulator
VLASRRSRYADHAARPRVAAPFGRSRPVQQLRSELQRLAALPQALLLIGESGTEPELLARFVHESGPRGAQPFIALSGRGLRDDQALAALDGSANGAPGLLEQARGGTLYLGNIEELPEAAARWLGSVLESGQMQRRDGNGSERLDVRMIACARPGVESRVGQGALTRDLYAQAAALVLRVPSLREYAEDVPDLLRHCIDELTESEQLRFRRVSVAAQNRLRNYPWPDNQRELRNLVRRLLQRGGAEEISLEEVEHELTAQAPIDAPLVQQDLLALPMREAREHFERAYLQQQLQLCNGKVGQLAKRVGMERTHLYRKLRSLGIEISQSAED